MRNGKLSLESIVSISDDAVSRDLEGKEVILNLSSGKLFGLNEVGTGIWELIRQHGTLEQVLAALRTKYAAPPEIIKADLFKLIAELYDRGLISVSTTGT